MKTLIIMFIRDMKNDEKKIDKKKRRENKKFFKKNTKNLYRIHLFQSAISHW